LKLTPVDVQNKEFKRELFGFNRNEVQDFLALVAQTLEELYDEIDQAKKEIESLKSTLREWESKREEIIAMVETTNRRAKEIIENAKAEALKLLDETNKDIARRENEFQLAMMKKKTELLALNNIKEGFIRRLASFLESGKKLIDTFEQQYEIRETKKLSLMMGEGYEFFESLPYSVIAKHSHFKQRRSERGKDEPDNAES